MDLVGAYADHLDALMTKLGKFLRKSLSGVNVKIGRIAIQSFSDLTKWLYNAGLIIHVHDRHQQCVRAQHRSDGRGRDCAPRIRENPSNFKPSVLKRLTWLQYRLVLD